MNVRLQAAAFFVLVVFLAACGTTTFTSTWKAPQAQNLTPVGKTIGAVFMSREEGRRRAGEDALVADLNARGAHGIASYTVIPSAQPKDSQLALERLKQAGCTSAVVMRVVGKDQEVSYSPGYVAPVYYGGFGPYWGYGWGTVYDPGYLRTDTYVSVETLVYSLQQDKLVWASTSRTANPSNLDTLINEVADATAKEMVRQGFLAP
jgi:hypothetical protein